MQTGSIRRGTIIRLVASVLIITVAIWVFFNRQFLLDEVALRSYAPPSEIEALANDDTMTSTGKRYFYVSRPEIQNQDEFNASCQSRGEESIILGCYVGQRIYLYNVTDQRLSGVEQVTAAHEMLHAAYDRMGDDERNKVNQMITSQLGSITDPRILGLIKLYQKSEPGQVTNELHSILGTEVRSLSAELEDYYKKYFNNRGKVVSYSEAYEGVFSQLRAEQEQLTARLNELNNTIKQRMSSFNSSITKLNTDIAGFNNRANNGGFNSEAQFNSERSALVERQQELQAERGEINGLIDEYEQTRKRLESLIIQTQSLNEALDSTPEEVPTL